jgi:hypothetical protein
MVARPEIIQFQAHPQNVGEREAGVVFEGIVIHTTAGGSTLEALGSWFGGGNIAAGMRGSAHFGVDRAGRIGQYVPLDKRPVAHGAESGSTAKILRGNEGHTTNDYLIGIEHLDAGTPGSVTADQIIASAWLGAWLWETEIAPHAERTGAVLDLDHLLQHKDLAPRSKPICASWPLARMQDHLRRIEDRLNPPIPRPDDRDEQIRLLTASKIGLRDAYTATVQTLIAQKQEARNAEARLTEAIRSAQDAIARHGN